jgi:hypothetical protein
MADEITLNDSSKHMENPSIHEMPVFLFLLCPISRSLAKQTIATAMNIARHNETSQNWNAFAEFIETGSSKGVFAAYDYLSLTVFNSTVCFFSKKLKSRD